MNIEDAVSRVDRAINYGDLAKKELVNLDSHPVFYSSKDDTAFSPKLTKEYVLLNHDNIYDVMYKLKELATTPFPQKEKYHNTKDYFKNKNYYNYSMLAIGLGAPALGVLGMNLENIPMIISGIVIAVAGAASAYYHNEKSSDLQYDSGMIEYRADSLYNICLAAKFNKPNTKLFVKELDSYIFSLDNFIQKFVPDKNYDKFEHIVNNYIEINLFKKDLSKIVSLIHKNNSLQKRKGNSIFIPLKKLFSNRVPAETKI